MTVPPSTPPAPRRRRRRARWLRRLLAAGLLTALSPYPVAWLRLALDDDQPSRSAGSVARGSLAHGHPMPPSGRGYRTYAYLGSALGRQYVNRALRDTLVDTFTDRAREERGRVFVLGETGWPSGGRMWPHRTHRNGLSVDVFMPLADADGAPATPPCWPWNLFCYGLDIDDRGALGDARIDFDSLAGLLRSLDGRATEHGLQIERIIVAPEYLPLLFHTVQGRLLGPLRRRFLRRAAWVRHDEHVHIDFQSSHGS